MLNRLFKKNKGSRKTGIYVLESEGLSEIEIRPGNGSVNSIIHYLGYDLTQVYTVFTFDSNKVDIIGVKIFSKQVVFVITKPEVVNFTIQELNEELRLVDWGFEYNSSTVEEILDEGIEEGNLRLDYLNQVMTLKQDSNGVFLAEDIGPYLQFKDEVLTNYSSSDLANAAAKWLKGLNLQMFNQYFNEARKHHPTDFEAMEEVNFQCNAMQSTPNLMGNENIEEHTKNNGNINFYNLIVAHHGHKVKKEDFEIVNKGRIEYVSNSELLVGNYVYTFDDLGDVNSCRKKNTQ
jgi:hypothetical protein